MKDFYATDNTFMLQTSQNKTAKREHFLHRTKCNQVNWIMFPDNDSFISLKDKYTPTEVEAELKIHIAHFYIFFSCSRSFFGDNYVKLNMHFQQLYSF